VAEQGYNSLMVQANSPNTRLLSRGKLLELYAFGRRKALMSAKSRLFSKSAIGDNEWEPRNSWLPVKALN
jgi:hypothetical protein